MDDRQRIVWIALIVGAFLLAFFIAPKSLDSLKSDSVRICDCLGIKRGSICFGVPSSCKAVRLESQGFSVEEEKKGIEISLIMDRSASMEGLKLSGAVRAAENLVDSMQDKDRLAIISFNRDSALVQDFTDNKAYLKERLLGITAEGGTRYLPALNTAIYQTAYTGLRESKVVFLTDGEPEDLDAKDVIYSKVQELAERGSCIYTIGYGNLSDNAVDILQGMALTSKRISGCGRYYGSEEDMMALRDILSRIMDDHSGSELKIMIESPLPKSYKADAIPLIISTNVDAFCSYSLNGKTKQQMVSFNMTISPFQGKNELEITCQGYMGRQETRKATVVFYADRSLRQRAPEIPLKDRDIASILSDIAASEGFSVNSRIVGRENDTLLAFTIENPKPLTLNSVLVRQYIPEEVSQGSIASDQIHSVVQETPIVVEFPFDRIGPGERASIAYSLPGRIGAEDAKQIRTQITHASIDNEDISQVISKNEETRKHLDVRLNKDSSPGRTGLLLSFSPKAEMKDLKVYLNIPKCMADRLNKVYFRNSNYLVLADDPMVLWNFADVKELPELSAEVDADIYDDCLEEVGIVTIAEGIAEDERHDRFGPLLPAMMFALIVVLYILDKAYLEANYRKTSATSKVAIACIFVILILTLAYPRPREKDGFACACFGVAYMEDCYGFTYRCEAAHDYSAVAEDYCAFRSCDEMMGTGKSEHQPSDLTLIMDRSYSMLGYKMAEAKNAAAALLSRLSGTDRLALIQFDNESELALPFTDDTLLLSGKIKEMEPRWSTAFVPPLRDAYYNYLFNSRNSSRKHIIFVSDGAPHDGHAAILAEVNRLAELGVCLITIGFGAEISQGSEAEQILKGMATRSNELTGCGSYYYSPDEMDSLKDSIQEAFEESRLDRQAVDVRAEMSSLDLTTAEPLFLDAAAELSGMEKRDCRIPFKLAVQTDTGFESSLLYDRDSMRYYLGDMRFPQGKHILELVATPFAGRQSCGSYAFPLGSLTVRPFSGFTACQTDSCQSVADYLSLESNDTAQVYVTENGFLPQNISIRQGTIVTWTNRGREPHEIVSGEGMWDGLYSAYLLPGESFSFTFPSGGPFFYFDNLSGKAGRGMDPQLRSIVSAYQEGMDLAIVIDQSGSMSGQMMGEVKNATKKLVSSLTRNDRIAVVKFSDSAHLVSSFTDDKELVMRKIDELYATGGTLYLPALDKAETAFKDKSTARAKVMIFFSDGEPWDVGGKQAILSKVSRIVGTGICVYAVGYGPEISRGSRGEQVLRDIVEISRNDTQCGRYLYSRSDGTSLSRIFGTIYYESKSNRDSLEVIPRISRKLISENETLMVSARVLSSFNRKPLPGATESSCGPLAKVTAYFIDQKNRTVLERELAYSGSASGYLAHVNGLPPGIFTVRFAAKSMTSTEMSCSYQGSAEKQVIVQGKGRAEVDYLFVGLIVMLIVLMFAVITRKGKMKEIEPEQEDGID